MYRNFIFWHNSTEFGGIEVCMYATEEWMTNLFLGSAHLQAAPYVFFLWDLIFPFSLQYPQVATMGRVIGHVF